MKNLKLKNIWPEINNTFVFFFALRLIVYTTIFCTIYFLFFYFTYPKYVIFLLVFTFLVYFSYQKFYKRIKRPFYIRVKLTTLTMLIIFFVQAKKSKKVWYQNLLLCLWVLLFVCLSYIGFYCLQLFFTVVCIEIFLSVFFIFSSLLLVFLRSVWKYNNHVQEHLWNVDFMNEIYNIYATLFDYYYNKKFFIFRTQRFAYNSRARYEHLFGIKRRSREIWQRNEWEVFQGPWIPRYDICYGLEFQLVAVKHTWVTVHFQKTRNFNFDYLSRFFPARPFPTWKIDKEEYNILKDVDEFFFWYSQLQPHWRHRGPYLPPIKLISKAKDPFSIARLWNKIRWVTPVPSTYRGYIFYFFQWVVERASIEKYHRSLNVNYDTYNAISFLRIIRFFIGKRQYKYSPKNNLRAFAQKTRRPPYIHWWHRGIIDWRPFYTIRILLRRYFFKTSFNWNWKWYDID